jgi:hypothetical protein
MKRHFAVAMLICVAFCGPALGQRPDKFLCIDARYKENSAVIAGNPKDSKRAKDGKDTTKDGKDSRDSKDHKNSCSDVRSDGFLDKREAPELHIYNRKFLTDYNVEITGVTTPQPAVIRGIEEAANLTLGAPSLIPPPAKGGAIALSATNAATVLQQLLDETQANKPAAELESDYQELLREKNQIELDLAALKKQYHLLADPLQLEDLDCETIGGAPNLPDVRQCLTNELGAVESASLADEPGFRMINVRAKYLLDTMSALQAMITRANLPATIASLDTEITQFEKNVDTFQANGDAMLNALALYEGIKSDETARRELKRGQLKVYFKNRLGSILDDAELNHLVDTVYDSLKRTGFSVANQGAATLSGCLAPKKAALTRLNTTAPLRARWNRLETGSTKDLPQEINKVNALQSQLVEHINYIYDHSAIPDPLVKQIDLSSYSGNLIVYYRIHRVENFSRYQIVTPVVGAGSGGNAKVATLPTTVATAPTAPAATTPAAATTSASSSTSTTTPTPSTPAPPPPGDVVAQGSFEVHEFDRAAVVAGFVFSRLHNNSYSALPTTTNGTTTYTAVLSSQPFQPHVLIGVDYYFCPKDSFPAKGRGYHPKFSDFGVLGGVSANALNNYFVGLAWEPSLGFNFGVGAHSGTETRLQGPPQIATSTVPTYDQRVTKLFVMAGFDLKIFRKIFGSVTGVGTSASTTGSSQ